jgi:hypothetical protein
MTYFRYKFLFADGKTFSIVARSISEAENCLVSPIKLLSIDRVYPQPKMSNPALRFTENVLIDGKLYGPDAKIYRVRRELDSVSKRIDELHEHLSNRPYPFLQWNIQDSINILAEKHTALSNELNKLAENPNYGYE